MKLWLSLGFGGGLLLQAGLFSVVAATEPAVAPAIEFHEIEVAITGGNTCTLSWVKFDPERVALKVISNGSDFKNPVYASLQQAVEANGCVAGTNGGFFDHDPFSAVGYLVADTAVLAERPDKLWMHGLVMVAEGKLQLGEIDELLPGAHPSMALQSGPRLIKAGLAASDLHGPQRAWRTFIARSADGYWILGVAKPVTLSQLAESLLAPEMKQLIEIEYALNLDGGPSSGLFFKQDDQVVFNKNTARVQNFIGLALRDPE